MDPLRPTQKDIARLAKVTQATVSLALRDETRVAPATLARIKAAATQLGYQPDPYLTGLSVYRKRLRPAEVRATIGWLSNDADGSSWKKSRAFVGYHEGACDRARQLGYRLEEHCLCARGLSPERMKQILLTRGITGLLLPPQPVHHGKLEFPFDKFSVVTFGFTLAEPRLHLVTLHQFQAMDTAFTRLCELGYRRIGLAMSEDSDLRANNNWSAAFWSRQRRIPPRQRVPMLLPPSPGMNAGVFMDWFRRHRPDAVLSISPEVLDWMTEAGLRVPADAGLALLSVPDSMPRVSGITENPRVIGAKAVEYLVDLIHRGERGCPAVRLNLLVEGTWLPGRTVRAAP